jgi:predicted RNA-binding protein YlqC (UPF0109 family)
MKEFLEFVLQRLVDNPGEVVVEESGNAASVTYHVSVHADDIGKVIGRNGKTIGAIRGLMMAAAAKNNQRVAVEVLETVDGNR